MAGYIMTIDDLDALKECIRTGIYSTRLKSPRNNNWGISHEGTFADYYSMKDGDNIYFFHKRKIYGIGRISNINCDCKFLSYIDADSPVDYSDNEYKLKDPLCNFLESDNRCFCTFVPNPFFFMQSVDMDEVLGSAPEKFRMLRAMWKVSFIKIDDEENKALFDIILKKNEENLDGKNNIFSFDKNVQMSIGTKVRQEYRLSAYNILLNAGTSNGKIRHEMAIEASLCDTLQKNNSTVFGKWDYISHQVIASPFKPVDYMDKMDIFGYRYIPGYNTISKYLVIEIKKDEATEDVIDQIMKYVDWINQEYSHGDYSMIEAYVVASSFPDNVISKANQVCVRNFTKGYRPAVPCTWKNVRLISYDYENGELKYKEI